LAVRRVVGEVGRYVLRGFVALAIGGGGFGRSNDRGHRRGDDAMAVAVFKEGLPVF
jgi:hypothetical protein